MNFDKENMNFVKRKKQREDCFLYLEEEIRTNFVLKLIHNPGNNRGYNEEEYMKNDTWNRKRNARAKRALLVLIDVLTY